MYVSVNPFGSQKRVLNLPELESQAMALGTELRSSLQSFLQPHNEFF